MVCRRFYIVFTLVFVTGCELHDPALSSVSFLENTPRILITKNAVACLLKTDFRDRNGADSELSIALNELCRSYIDGTISLEQYGSGIVASKPLLFASKAGAYFLASGPSINKNFYDDIVELIKPVAGMKELCKIIILSPHDKVQPISQLCNDAFRLKNI
jgi:hypothetical protein